MLTDERIDSLKERHTIQLIKTMEPVFDYFWFARVIEAEVLQAQDPVAWLAFADNNGPVPLELWGFDKKACKNAVLENARAVGWKGTVEGYLFQRGWTIRPLGFLAPQPPALSIDVDALSNIIRAADGSHSLGAGALAEKIIGAIGSQPPAPCPECNIEYERGKEDGWQSCKIYHGIVDGKHLWMMSMQAKVAEQSAEIERLTKERDEYKSAWQRAGEEYRKLRDSILALTGKFK